MANRAVSIWKHIKLNGKWRFATVYRNPKNHKLEANKVVVSDKTLDAPEGTFYISWYEGEKKRWKKIGPRLQNAEVAASQQEYVMEGKLRGVTVVMPEGNRVGLAGAVADYLDEVKLSRRPATYDLQSYNLNQFVEWSGLRYLDEVNRLTLLKYKDHLLREGAAPRTAAYKMMRVNQFLRVTMKIPAGQGPVTKRDARVTDAMPIVFEQAELDAFFAACKPQHHLLFSTFLQSGCRKQELMYAYWDDLDFERGTITVRAKPEYGFDVKTYEEREIPLSTELMARLKKAKEKSKCRLIFPTRTGKPNTKMWDVCKSITRRAGLDETKFSLHAFRRTFCTTMMRKGFDLRSVQHLMGHHDIESTMRYLAPATNSELRDKVEAVWGEKPGPRLVAAGA